MMLVVKNHQGILAWLGVASCVVLLFASVSSQVRANQMTIGSKSKPEAIYGVSLAQNKISFDVLSTGCTKADDFSLSVLLLEDNTLAVLLTRLVPDNCRAMPKIKRINLPLVQMNDDRTTKVLVQNPFSINKPGRKGSRKF